MITLRVRWSLRSIVHKLISAELPRHDHSSRTLLLRSIVDTVSITRDYTPRSLYYCLFEPHISMVLFFTHFPFVVNHKFNATPPERLQQYIRFWFGLWKDLKRYYHYSPQFGLFMFLTKHVVSKENFVAKLWWNTFDNCDCVTTDCHLQSKFTRFENTFAGKIEIHALI